MISSIRHDRDQGHEDQRADHPGGMGRRPAADTAAKVMARRQRRRLACSTRGTAANIRPDARSPSGRSPSTSPARRPATQPRRTTSAEATAASRPERTTRSRWSPTAEYGDRDRRSRTERAPVARPQIGAAMRHRREQCGAADECFSRSGSSTPTSSAPRAVPAERERYHPWLRRRPSRPTPEAPRTGSAVRPDGPHPASCATATPSVVVGVLHPARPVGHRSAHRRLRTGAGAPGVVYGRTQRCVHSYAWDTDCSPGHRGGGGRDHRHEVQRGLHPAVALAASPSLGYVLAFALLAQTLKTLSVGTAYAIWAGAGTAAIAAIGMLFLGESAQPGEGRRDRADHRRGRGAQPGRGALMARRYDPERRAADHRRGDPGRRGARASPG